MDLARLGIVVSSSDLEKGSRRMRNFRADAQKAEKQTTMFGVAAKRSFAMLAGAGAALGIMAGVAAGAGAAVRTITDFEASLSRLEAVSGATASQLDGMERSARLLGSTTEFSAMQAADGLNFLAMAGFNAEESIAAIPSVLSLATAGNIGLAQSADIASNVLSGFGISADEAARVADVLAATSSSANTNVGQLGEAMSTAAPISKALGISLESTAAAIGVLSDAGIQGSRSGTALRAVFASLAGPTSQATDVLKQYGLAASDVNPQTVGLATALDRLKSAGLNAGDAMKVFGREGASGALVMIEGASRVRSFTRELEGAEGAADDMAATMRDNLQGDIQTLMSSLQEVALALGDLGLLAILRGVIKAFTEAARVVSFFVSVANSMKDTFFGLFEGADAASRATDNLSLAMADEISAAQKLLSVTEPNRVMSLDIAGVKLAQARAHLSAVEAIRQERIEMIKSSDAYVRATELQAQLNEDLAYYYELRDQNPGEEGAGDVARLRDMLTALQRAVEWQENLLGDAAQLSPEYQAAQDAIAELENGIANSKDGMVNLNGEIVTADELGDRLAITLGSVNVDGAISGVSVLAHDLGVSLDVANQLNAALDRDAGIVAPAPAAGGSRGLSYGLGASDVIVSGTNLGFGDSGGTTNPTNIANYRAPDATSRLIGSSGGGGGGGRRSGGGGGGGVSSAEREAQREHNDNMREAERILNGMMTPQDEYNDALDQANRLLDAGVLPLSAYNKHVDNLATELQDAKREATGLTDLVDEFESSAINAAMGAEGAMDKFTESIKRAALEFVLFGKGPLSDLGDGSGLLGNLASSFGFGAPDVSASPSGQIVTDLVSNLPSFNGGGDTPRGPRTGGIDGLGGFLAINHPNETIIDHTKGQSSGGVIELRVTTEGGVTLETVINTTGAMITQNNKQIPNLVKKTNNDPRFNNG